MAQTKHLYDLFISYADADRAWVEGYLLDAVTQAGVRWHSEEAFRLGVPRLLEFEDAVRESARTLLVLSPAYLAEHLDRFVDVLAQSYGLETATSLIIPLILQPVELPPRLAMLTALNATDRDDWKAVVERLCVELERPVPGPAPKPPCPYPGMKPFSEADSELFFGRDEEIRELLERLRLHPFITVIGPSGSGKSSLVFAGLVPALRKSGLFGPGGWLVRTVRPGEAPLAALAAALGGDPANPAQAVSDLVARHADARRLLLVVDQFEEQFTLSEDREVEPFQQALFRLVGTPDCYVVLTVRSDFYSQLMVSPMWERIRSHRAEVVPLDEQGLRQAIVRPAECVDAHVEEKLVERLLKHAAGGQPGILSLLQEALRLLWEQLERRLLPLKAYEDLGRDGKTGLQVAMARHADAALAGLTAEQETMARRAFLRLIQFGQRRPDTRRQQPVAALRSVDDDPAQFEETLRRLADHRLLTLSGEEERADWQVDLAHEALISGWPTLSGWLAERREAEQTRRRLEDKAKEWVRFGRGSGGLLDKDELFEAKHWLDRPDATDLGYSDELDALVKASHTALRAQRLGQLVTVALGLIVALLLLGASAIAVYRERVRRTIGTELVAVSGGPAIIGTDDLEAMPAERPRRTVNLLPFQIGKYEVTNRQYRACVEFGPCTSPMVTDDYEEEALEDHPVEWVSAEQAHDYCTWLGRRLPTTMEWERAARGSEGRLWPWGNDRMPAEGYEFPTDTVPVASEPETATPPPGRIYHLADNVQEWVVRVPADCEGAACHHAWDGETDATAIMGGAHDENIDRVTQVTNYSPDRPLQSVGFRCAADSLP